jgi:hypothetical protein
VIAETLPQEVLEKMHAPPKSDVPIISPKELTEADGELVYPLEMIGKYAPLLEWRVYLVDKINNLLLDIGVGSWQCARK